MSRPGTAEMTLAAQLLGSSERATGSGAITFIYHAEKPYSVLMTFEKADGSTIVWEIARELLKDGIEGRSGLGDARFLRVGRTVHMRLETRDGYALYVLDRCDLVAFLKSSRRVCEYGDEDVSAAVDAAAELLLLAGGER